MNQHALSAFIWSVADLLRGDYKQSEYGKVILPFTVLRRLDCVLEPTKDKVLAEAAARKKEKVNPDPFLRRKSGAKFYNASPLNLPKLMGDQDHIRQNLDSYVAGFSPEARDIFEQVRVRDPGRTPRQGEPAVPGHREVRQHRPAPEGGGQRPDGPGLRGADP